MLLAYFHRMLFHFLSSDPARVWSAAFRSSKVLLFMISAGWFLLEACESAVLRRTLICRLVTFYSPFFGLTDGERHRWWFLFDESAASFSSAVLTGLHTFYEIIHLPVQHYCSAQQWSLLSALQLDWLFLFFFHQVQSFMATSIQKDLRLLFECEIVPLNAA